MTAHECTLQELLNNAYGRIAALEAELSESRTVADALRGPFDSAPETIWRLKQHVADLKRKLEIESGAYHVLSLSWYEVTAERDRLREERDELRKDPPIIGSWHEKYVKLREALKEARSNLGFVATKIQEDWGYSSKRTEACEMIGMAREAIRVVLVQSVKEKSQ